jgi:hypothetical protein
MDLPKTEVLVEVDIDPTGTAPRAVPVSILAVIGPAIAKVVITIAATMPVVPAIRPAVVPEQALEETTEAALARTVALIAIKYIEQLIDHGETLSHSPCSQS